MKISLASNISKVTTMSDHTVRLQVDCQEAPAEVMAELFALKSKLGWFTFSEKVISEIDTRDFPEIKVEKWEKTPSQRLRATLYILWEQTKPDVTFEQYYREQVEKVISYLKEKLD